MENGTNDGLAQVGATSGHIIFIKSLLFQDSDTPLFRYSVKVLHWG